VSRDPTPAKPRTAYITPEGEQVLRDEYDRLWTEERPKVTQQVADAAALGDRSENAEYIYGKKRLREIDSRLRFLGRRLDELTVVREPPADPAAIYFGAWVRLEDAAGAERRFRLVGPDEFDVAAGRLSIDSPLGRALLGRREDDEVRVRRPKGDTVYTVLEIRYTAFEAD
jgi:transcription elongation factor GreB